MIRSDTKYNNQRPQQAYKLALLGATDKQIADVMEVNVNTIDLWKRKYSTFLQELNRGKDEADMEVAAAFFKRAVGYSVTEEHVTIYRGKILKYNITRQIPPDPWSAQKWLSMRQREKWADVQRTEILQTNVNINRFDFTGISTGDLLVLERLGVKQLAQNNNGEN